MSEENKNKAEPVPQKQLGYDPNAGIVNRLETLECESGEAILAIKINVSADSEGTKLGLGVSILGPDTKKVQSMIGGFLTMAANNLAVAIRDALKPMLTEKFTASVLVATEKEFTDVLANAKEHAAEKPEEVPHGDE